MLHKTRMTTPHKKKINKPDRQTNIGNYRVADYDFF